MTVTPRLVPPLPHTGTLNVALEHHVVAEDGGQLHVRATDGTAKANKRTTKRAKGNYDVMREFMRQ